MQRSARPKLSATPRQNTSHGGYRSRMLRSASPRWQWRRRGGSAQAPKAGWGSAAGDPVKHSLTFGPPAWGSTSGGSAKQRDCAWPREGPRSQRPSTTIPTTAGGCGRRTGRSLISFRGIQAPIWRGRCAVGWAGPSRSASARHPMPRGRDEAPGFSGLVWTLNPAARVCDVMNLFAVVI